MKILKRLLRLIRPYTFYLILSLVFASVSVVLTLMIPITAGKAIDIVVGEGMVDIPSLMPVLTRIAVCAVGLAVSQWLLGICNNKITFSCVRDIRNAAFDKITVLPLSYIDSHKSGETVNRVIADADQFADGLLMGFSQLFTGVLTIVGTLIIMFRESVSVALVVLLVTPISLFVASFIAKKSYNYFNEQTSARGAQTAVIDEMIGEKKTVSALALENEAQTRFDISNERFRRASLSATFFSSLTNPATRVVNNIVYAGVCMFGALNVIGDGSLTVGGLTCMLAYATQYTKPFNEISGVVTELQNAMSCIANIFSLIDSPERAPEGEKQLEGVSGEVAMDGVSFSYVKNQPLIENMNLSVSPGMRVAIVGPTGCGKTTLINLLMRFYDVNKGSISVDGNDIRDVTRKSLRKSYGMVLQETWLRSGTIRDNITVGKPDATDDDVIRAAKASHAHSFIKRLPDGYNTVIGEDGGNLSQGQKQLLCITRVMLCLPPMLILDEATSSIDTKTEMRIQKAFSTMMQGRTSFIVAHRLSTIKNSDLILVMKDGNIIECGTHRSLLEAGGFYSQLYNSQFAK